MPFLTLSNIVYFIKAAVIGNMGGALIVGGIMIEYYDATWSFLGRPMSYIIAALYAIMLLGSNITLFAANIFLVEVLLVFFLLLVYRMIIFGFWSGLISLLLQFAWIVLVKIVYSV